jgi:hypothetical protein
MGTAEWIALGLLLISLIGWRWWRGTPEGQRISQWIGPDKRSNKYDT